jgi:predicted nucleic acid-binding protein
VILDSNLVIYAARPEYSGLRRFIAERSPSASAVSLVEVLGYHKLSASDQKYFEAFFAVTEVLPVTDEVIARAVAVRQARKMSLGDALIAATALVFGHELLTHNLKDFAGVSGLKSSDPIADSKLT